MISAGNQFCFVASPVTVESHVMRTSFRRGPSFTGWLQRPHDRKQPDAPATPAPKPISEDLPPSQQLALLTLRRSELSKEIVTKLYHSTVRATPRDYEDLVQRRLATREGNLSHKLTPMGHTKANMLARELATTLGIKTTTHHEEISGRSRSTLRPGMFSQNGNW